MHTHCRRASQQEPDLVRYRGLSGAQDEEQCATLPLGVAKARSMVRMRFLIGAIPAQHACLLMCVVFNSVVCARQTQ